MTRLNGVRPSRKCIHSIPACVRRDTSISLSSITELRPLNCVRPANAFIASYHRCKQLRLWELLTQLPLFTCCGGGRNRDNTEDADDGWVSYLIFNNTARTAAFEPYNKFIVYRGLD